MRTPPPSLAGIGLEPPPGTPESASIATVTRTVMKRDGRTVEFDRSRISHAIEMAFRAEIGCPFPDPLRATVADQVESITGAVIECLPGHSAPGAPLSVEAIQDEVERQLMAAGAFAVARRYILYREARARRREEQSLRVRDGDGNEILLNQSLLRTWIDELCEGSQQRTFAKGIYEEVISSVPAGAPLQDVDRAIIFAARARIEQDPAYSFVAARALLRSLYTEVLGRRVALIEANERYAGVFSAFIREAVDLDLLDPELKTFDLDRLATAIDPGRDHLFQYLGLQTLYDRYLIHYRQRRLELPQMFWMRVAMGLALHETNREERAIEFYNLISTFRFCPSTPTLFNAGTRHPQLSSCYLTTIGDDLAQIFKSVRDNALLSKWSGGIGNDWTNVRALGSHINGTNGKSQGVIPFLKVANDAAVAVNQGGKRKGAVCAYLETWHLDIEEFLDLRKNTGDERRRTHDMNTAHWVPDLFMTRVQQDGQWTLFSPDDVADLHDFYGREFEERYVAYEALADQGALSLFKRVRAVDLWRKMLTALFETGHPWITFKDPSNIRSAQDHAGVVHNSNLCTEILLNTSEDEVAVCNLGSINLVAHIEDGQFDLTQLRATVRTAVRMLDNVIDLNYYPIPEARASNLRHRPIGLGQMGFQDALFELGLSYASEGAVEFADQTMESIAYYTILASSELAQERGTYPSYAGSKWDRGLLPLDTIQLLGEERGEPVDIDTSGSLDWAVVRKAVQQHGMRNSHTMAIAPTATIANILGVSQSIEPLYTNLYVKSNLSGEFTVVNHYLVRDLVARGLWDNQMLDDLKYFDGSAQPIDRVSPELKERYLTAFEVDPEWLIKCAARRQKWIDMGQSLNLYVAEPSGRKLSEMYFHAWKKGLKTTYYLRSLGATRNEKSTIDINSRGIQPRWMKARSASSDLHIDRDEPAGRQWPANDAGPTCNLEPGCESCE